MLQCQTNWQSKGSLRLSTYPSIGAKAKEEVLDKGLSLRISGNTIEMRPHDFTPLFSKIGHTDQFLWGYLKTDQINPSTLH